MKSMAFMAAIALTLSLPVTAQPRPDHFRGEPSPTLDRAIANLSAYNSKLEIVLAQDELSPTDLGQVHQLTYTLENALAKLRAELSDLAAVLEEIHVASETGDTETVSTRGRIYLDTSRKLIE